MWSFVPIDKLGEDSIPDRRFGGLDAFLNWPCKDVMSSWAVKDVADVRV